MPDNARTGNRTETAGSEVQRPNHCATKTPVIQLLGCPAVSVKYNLMPVSYVTTDLTKLVCCAENINFVQKVCENASNCGIPKFYPSPSTRICLIIIALKRTCTSQNPGSAATLQFPLMRMSASNVVYVTVFI